MSYLERKHLVLSALLIFYQQVIAFTIVDVSFRRPSKIMMSNILEGKEIENELTPINNMILVKLAEEVDQTDGGIFLTGKEKINKSEGEVVATGEGRINSETGFKSPMPVSVGETVCFGKFDGEEVQYNGSKHTLIRDDDIMVKFPAEKPHTIDNAEVIWDNVLVNVVEQNIEESGGILIAATTKKATISSIGEVVKVGTGRIAFNGVLMEMDVEVGEMIKFRDYAADTVDIDNRPYAVLRMSEILAKF